LALKSALRATADDYSRNVSCARKYMSTLYYMIHFKPILPSEKISNEPAIASFK